MEFYYEIFNTSYVATHCALLNCMKSFDCIGEHKSSFVTYFKFLTLAFPSES